MNERLQKIIAQNSEYSRRKVEELIINGNVKVNGKTIKKLGTKACLEDEILVNDHPLIKSEKVYYLLNKPEKVISSRKDEKDRICAVDLIDERFKIYPVGRLDYNTTGLLILTNDGELANKLTHPKNKIEKTYIAKVKGNLKRHLIYSLEEGIELEGKKTLPAKVEILNYSHSTEVGTIKITITEGRNHQIKNMFAAIGGKVIKLKRTNYAFLTIDNLPIGTYRLLKVKEVKKLYGMV